jgi:hypothetical protein
MLFIALKLGDAVEVLREFGEDFDDDRVVLKSSPKVLIPPVTAFHFSPNNSERKQAQPLSK